MKELNNFGYDSNYLNLLNVRYFETPLTELSNLQFEAVSKEIKIEDVYSFNFDDMPTDSFWETKYEKELRMHKIHAYPAKFPSFIVSKALEYAKKNYIFPNCIADIFCGCGTVALEARRNEINFWGCDINPVATMISKVKSHKYQLGRLIKYYESIITKFETMDINIDYEKANARLKYWYDSSHYNDLSRLNVAIRSSTPKNSFYQLFFLCAFSNILKSTSKWLTKSVKPQVDSNKVPSNVVESFRKQYGYMINAVKELRITGLSEITILNENIMDLSTKKPMVDMILSSPPYVTSYDYADIHQLSSLWLGYAEDYRTLRIGSIGSRYQQSDYETNFKELNHVGASIVEAIIKKSKPHARDIAKYFVDMQKVAYNSYNMLNKPGIALFVIGNTEYKGVKIDNVRHLALSMKNSGFNDIRVMKRKISSKLITPYRDEQGRFTKDSSQRHIYSEEFILIGMK